MRIFKLLFFSLFLFQISWGQKMDTVYLEENDKTKNMFVAVLPEDGQIKSFMILLDGFGNNPANVMSQTEIPEYASQNGILTVIPLLKTGPSYFGSDLASQQSLKEIIEFVINKYQLEEKDFYVGGFSIGGTCAVKFAELSIQENYSIKPSAVFAINPPLDWERYYNAAKRVVRLSNPAEVNQEVFYMIDRIEREMNGTPKNVLNNYYAQSPYSFSDTTQKAVKSLVEIPVMIISEPDILWWLNERNYDCSYNNIIDQSAMINELQRLGNKNAVLVTTTDRGYRKANNMKHPNSWSIADSEQVIKWLQSK